MIIAQRLLRRICERCKKPVQVDNAMLSPNENGNGSTFSRGKGCDACHSSGYSGRIAVYELLQVNGRLSEMIAKRGTASELRTEAAKYGMKSLREAAILKAGKGVTSFEEVMRETADPEVVL
jgi:type II secretory ATPase GspE/PulE/Tfp pilus assembly ATPase PilB-like protein